MKENKHYVYIYLDPRKPGWFEYGDLKFIFEPIYIGKGVGNRIDKHLKPGTKTTNKLFKNKLNKIKNPIRFKYNENLSDLESKNIEVKLIKLIGRKDLKLGPLCNLTDGGEGVTNNVPTLKQRTHSGVYTKDKPVSKESILKSAKSRTGLIQTGEHKRNACLGKGCVEILQYDLEGNFIREFELGYNFRKSEFKHVNELIRRGRRMGYGYLWIKKVENMIQNKIEKYTPSKKSPNKYKKC